jgi:hypothetical protein
MTAIASTAAAASALPAGAATNTSTSSSTSTGTLTVLSTTFTTSTTFSTTFVTTFTPPSVDSLVVTLSGCLRRTGADFASGSGLVPRAFGACPAALLVLTESLLAWGAGLALIAFLALD